MQRALVWVMGGALLVTVGALVMVTAEPTRQGLIFIAGDQPVTEDQVRQKLQSDGWSNVQIVRDGRYFEAIAAKDGQNSTIVVDSQTGRLRAGERADRADDDDDDD